MRVSGPVGPRPKKRAKRFTLLPLNVLLGSLGVFIFFVLVGMASKKRKKHGSTVSSSGKVDSDTGRPSLYTYKVVAEYPHDGEAFTQGLEYDSQCDEKGVCRDIFWESTGLNGHSTVREVDVKSGDVLRTASLDRKDFGEGLTRLGDQLYQLTWQSPKMLVYEVGNFDSVQIKHTPLKDGWGITNDGTNLIVGDSTHTLYYIDPKSMKIQRRIDVTDEGREVTWLNELEWVDGMVYANIWQRDCIAQIEPSTGHVVGWVDVSGLKTTMLKDLDSKSSRVDVFNGIAWNQKDGKLFVTGKLWPKIYEIELRPLYDDSKSTDVAGLTDKIRKQCIVHLPRV